jgi:beta-1,4-N-acetylglucosaminyltransferase
VQKKCYVECERYVLVTVGSTKFDDLIKTIDQESFIQKLIDLGFDGLHVQFGRSTYQPTVLPTANDTRKNFKIVLFEYSKTWKDEVSNAGLIIGHAGAGTILDSLEMKKPLIVVPNHQLMANHQADIAEELASGGYLLMSTTKNLMVALDELKTAELKEFPERENNVFRETLDAMVDRM